VFPVGRLEMDSRWALIMTNDGELANRLTHPRYGVEKTYIVEVDGRLTPGDVEKVKRGMWLGPEHGAGAAMRTERFRLKIVGRERGRTILEVKVSEGTNREIRRVMARLGHTVRDLNRVAIAGKVTTKGLEVGAYRKLSEEEVKWLFHASSPEYHNRERMATQAWYEAKEMEKERKRLASEEEKARTAPPAARGASAREAAKEVVREFRERPVRKGRKPFVPPSGRNAGKLLGGSKQNRKMMEKMLTRKQEDAEFGEERGSSAEMPHEAGPRAAHPLGGKVRREEE